nr:anthranilate phosphoribosyltransferase [Pirellula sp.]
GMDEVTLSAPTQVQHIAYGMLTQTTWTPASFGLEPIRVDDLIVDGPKESADAIRSILQGQRGPKRDIVVANTAATLWVSGHTHSLVDGVAKAQQAIDTGKAAAVLHKLSQLSHQV